MKCPRCGEPEHPDNCTMRGPFDYDRSAKLREAVNLNAAIQMFLDRWSPDDAPQFQMEFIEIIRRCHMEATEPFARQIAATIRAMPMPPYLVGAPKQQS